MYNLEMMNAGRRNCIRALSLVLFLAMFSFSVMMTGCSGGSDTTAPGFLQEGHDLIMTHDGEYVIVGRTMLDYYMANMGYIIKLNQDIYPLWDMKFNCSRILGVIETVEGEYITLSEIGAYNALRLRRISSNGALLWSTILGTIEGYNISHHSFKRTLDGGIIISGGQAIQPNTPEEHLDMLLLKTDAEGNEMWRRNFGGALDRDDYGMAVDLTDDGGYIVSGYRDGKYSFAPNIYLLKTDEIGQEEWSCTYEFDGYPRGIVVITSRSGGYLVVGDCNDWGYVLLRTDTEGNQLWHKNTCSSDDSVFKKTFTAIETEQGDILVAGYSGSALYKVQVFVEKMDSLGNTLWERTYCLDGDNDHGADMAYSIKAVDNNCYILTGVMGRRFYDPDYKITGDIFLMKIDADGNMLGF